MAVYKVIQDIEAEDKLIGWMTPRQTIYAAIVVISGFIAFLLMTNNLWYISIFLLPHMVLFGLLAGPFVHDQPSEVWLLAKIKFSLKPQRRIWDQSGLKELVTVTVPKKIERRLTDGLSQTEVRSRLEALANTIDSRGWAVKNINVNLYTQPEYAMAGSDRLVDSSTLPQEVSSLDVRADDDVMDEQNNAVAKQLDQMITQSTQSRKQQVVQQMHNPTTSQPPADYWFMNATAGQQAQTAPGYATFDHSQTVAPGAAQPTTPVVTGPSDDAQQALLSKIHEEQNKPKEANKHLRTIKTTKEIEAEERAKQAEVAAQKAANPAVQQFANNNDLMVDAIARQASRPVQQNDDGEVVISLR
jgi:hypothetical protein